MEENFLIQSLPPLPVIKSIYSKVLVRCRPCEASFLGSEMEQEYHGVLTLAHRAFSLFLRRRAITRMR